MTLYNLTKPQKLIYDEEKTIGSSIANIAGSILFEGNGDKAKVKNILTKICEINNAFRIRITEKYGEPMQYVSDELPQISMLSFVSESDFESFAKMQAKAPIGIDGCLCEFYGIILPEKFGVFARLHHIVSDAWTLSLLGNQFVALYNDENAEIGAYSYLDYIESEQKYLESKRYQKDITYWTDKLKLCDEVTLLSEKNTYSVKAERFSVKLNADKVELIKKYAEANNTSLFTVFMTALGCYINRTRDNVRNFYVGTAVLNRSNLAEKNTAGMFINTVPLLLNIDETKTFLEALAEVQDECMQAFRHERFNYGDVLSLYRKQNKDGGNLYDVIFSYQNATVGSVGSTKWYHCGQQAETLQIHIDDRDETGTLTVNYDYQTAKLNAREIQALHEHLFNLIFDEIAKCGICEDDYIIDEIPEDEKLNPNEIDITIGKPIANTQIYILDKYLNPVPIGIPGELCIAGDGVGAGYLNRPELTAEKFVDNPFGEGKMYKTGDIAKWRYDGNIEFIGRNDFQVKIRGLRIELGEIENAISAYNGIRQAVVIADKDDNGHQYLAGYYTSEKDVDEKALRKAVGSKLPKYMVPHYLVHLDEIPMTTSGKISHKALPKPDFSSLTASEYVAPRNLTEEKLCKIYSELLHIEKISVDDDFFDLGGDSLLSITLITKIEQEFDKNISTKDIMQNATVAELAVMLGEITDTREKIEVLNTDEYPITPQQMGVYTACVSEKDSVLYNMPMKVTFPENVDIEKVKQAMQAVFENHKSMHTYFISKGDRIYGVYDRNCKLDIEENTEESSFLRPFDLSKAPLFRVGFNGRTMFVDMHHIISDGTSVHNLLNELTAVYEGKDLTEHELTYGDYAIHIDNKINGGKYGDAFDFYRSMLKFDFEPMELPMKRHTENDNKGQNLFAMIPSELFAKCKKYAKEHNITDTAFFMAVYGILLTRYCTNDNVLTSLTLTNREYSQCRNTSGMFVNTVPVMFEVDENNTFEEYAGYVNELLLDIYKYQELPFVTIANELKIDNKKAMNTSFVYQAQGEIFFDFAGKRINPQFLETETAKFDLTTEIIPNENGARLRMEYNSGKMNGNMVQRMADSFVLLLEQITKIG